MIYARAHMSWEWFLLFLVAGAIAGFLAGLLGIGGGMVLVPVLFFALGHLDLPPVRLMHVAISTSLAATAITTIASSWSHFKKNAIHYKTLRYLIFGTAIGCITGAIIANYLPGTALRNLFCIMVFIMGGYFLFPQIPHLFIASEPNWTLNLFGFVIGNLSSLLGIGGGMFTVPVLLGYQSSMKTAVAVSSVATLATVWIGSITYLIISWRLPGYPGVFGYIHLWAFLAIALGSLSMTSFGVKCAHELEGNFLKRIFGVVLILMGISIAVF